MFFLENEYLLEEEEVQPTNLGLDGLEGALLAVSECDETWFNLREKMMKLEHTAIVTEDAMLLEEGKKSFLDNVKNMFQALKQKVEELFKKFMDWISRFVGTDKQLVERLKKANGAQSATVKGYSFKGLAAFGDKIASSAASVNSFTLTGQENEQYTAVLSKIGGSKQVSSPSEFTKALREIAFGSAEKGEQPMAKAEVVSILEKAKDDIAKAKRVKSGIQKFLDASIKSDNARETKLNTRTSLDATMDGVEAKQVNKDAKAAGKESGKNAGARRAIAKNFVIAYGVYIEGLKTQRLQARAAVGQLLGGGSKEETPKEEEAKNESALFTGILGQF